MNILITNDDGIDAEGIRILARTLSDTHRVLVVAPASEKSATSHSLTILKYMDFKRRDFDGIEAYSLEGTPADCVKFFMLQMRTFTPDLVLSGINHGLNLGRDVHYSGTASAAVEGALLGIRSAALSMASDCSLQKFADFSEFIKDYIPTLTNFNGTGGAYNINYPNAEKDQVKGVAFSRLGGITFNDRYESEDNGGGRYMLTGEPLEQVQPHTDVWYVRRGHIAVTPLISDITDFEALKKLEDSGT